MSDATEAGTDATGPRLDGVRVLVLFGGSNLFGQERANLEVMRTIRDEGAAVCFVTNSRFGRENVQREVERLGFPSTTAPYGYHWSRHLLGRDFGHLLLNLYGVVATSVSVHRVIRSWKPTHLYAMNWSYFLFALPAIALSKLPLVYRAGDTLPEHTAFHRWIGRQLRRQVTRLICNCQFVARSFSRLGFAPSVIYNHPPVRNAPEEISLPPGEFGARRTGDQVTLLYVGQIAQHKGVSVLVEAVIELIHGGSDVTLLVAGDSVWGDPLRRQLEETVAKAGLVDRIHFLGPVENVPALFRKADLHICPSIWEEPSPNVIVEAKREGVPSVAFPVGGIPELIEHGVDGYLCRSVTRDSLIEGIKHFAGDAPQRQRAGRAARESYERNFGFRRFQRQWAEVFSDNQEQC